MKKVIIFLVLLNLATVGYALRITRPPTMTLPITPDQVSQLNRYMEQVWNIQNGRISLDIVTSAKSGATEGEMWILKNGAVYSLQYKAGDQVRTLTP
jgi:hypothetical protein